MQVALAAQVLQVVRGSSGVDGGGRDEVMMILQRADRQRVVGKKCVIAAHFIFLLRLINFSLN